MEESKDQYQNTDSQKIFLNKNHKSVNFSVNNFSKIVPQLLNLRNLNENLNKTNNENINNINNINNNNNSIKINTDKKKLNLYRSPQKKSKIFNKSSLRKQSCQTLNTFFSSYKNNLKEPSLNIEISQNNKSPNLNTISDSFKNNYKLSLKRVNTGIRQSAFTLKNKRFSNARLYNKIKFRNSKNFFGSNEFKNLLKSEGEEKTGTTTLFTDRNKKDIIKLKNLSRRSSLNNKINNINTINNIHINQRMKTTSESKNYIKSTFIKKNKYQNKHTIPIIVNPLLISEEDKIFDEMKKYLCFKYEQKKLNNKSKDTKKTMDKMKGNASKLKKLKPKIQTDEQIKLDYLYLSTTKISKKIRYIKRKKDRQDLAEYQNNLLDVIKPSVSDYTYAHLKDKLIDIRLKNNKKYQNNYKKIKEIENIEEDIINDFNSICEKCLETFRRVRAQKEIVHSNNLKIKLPLLNFISCLKKKKKQSKRK